MAFGVGSAGNIVRDFTNSLNEIFGQNNNSGGTEKGGPGLFSNNVGGSLEYKPQNWIGNTKRKGFVRYGFLILDLEQVVGRKSITQTYESAENTGGATFFLQIPPQALQQKEIFANQIQATRRGVIVETEGVVFRDIVLQGTTGIFPGERGKANNPLPNKNFTQAPKQPAGVDAETGRSTASNVSTISGYEEFIRLRQFLLKYAKDKVDRDGDLFLIFINEKDAQQLIVEPLDFTMTRSASSPMTYEYKITLKGIGDLNGLFQNFAPDGRAGGFLGFLESVQNISANVSATVATGRAVINQSARLLSRISQAIDQTVNGPLRQVQFALEDLNNGLSTVLSLPEILYRNATNAVLNIRQNVDQIGNTVNSAFGSQGSTPSSTGIIASKAGRTPNAQESAVAATLFNEQQDVLKKIQSDARIPVQRSFVQDLKFEINEIGNKVADFVGLGSPEFDAIKGRINTAQPDPLKVINDQEISLLSSLVDTSQALNLTLATNVIYESEAELAFEQAAAAFNSGNLPEDQVIQLRAPRSVREVTIQQGDTLERIAQREYGSALRWLDIVVLNDLKPPYLASIKQDGVKVPGERLLIGVG